MSQPVESFRKVIWENVIFFSAITLLGTLGAGFYAWHYGISLPEWILFFFYAAATGMSITIGYHRLFAHATFKAHPFVQFLVLFFGAAAFEHSALRWASQHRDHHRYVDTDQDPYSIKKGFFYAHIGWLLFWRHTYNYDNAKDLQKNSLITHQSENYYLWCIGAGILTPVLIGALTGHWLGGILIGVCTRLTVVHHSTFFINSACHMFGKATYDNNSSAKDHWFVALLTNGEGYHNFHHRFPSDYRNAILWYQWDPSKWLIALLAKLGLAWDLKTVSKFRIFEARIAAENQRAEALLQKLGHGPEASITMETLKNRYAQLRQTLMDWESRAREYQGSFREQLAIGSEKLHSFNSAYQDQVIAAKRHYQQSLKQWNSILGIVLS